MRPSIATFLQALLAATALVACASVPASQLGVRSSEPPLSNAPERPNSAAEDLPTPAEPRAIATAQDIGSETPKAPEPPSRKPERIAPVTTSRSAAKSLADANSGARQRAAPGTFDDATLLYAFEPGAIYELQTSPDFVSTLLLEPGELLIDIAAADTVRWNVSNTVSGDRAILIVKPSAAKLKTNIVLVTDRRAYLVEAVSAAGDVYTAQAAWTYPVTAEASQSSTKPKLAAGPTHEAYVIKAPRKGPPAWMPQKVWDDGLKTYVQFPDGIAAADMPPLFIRTPEGLELVNYRIDGTRYEIDRIFEEAELRLGARKPVIVRIQRKPPANTKARS